MNQAILDLIKEPLKVSPTNLFIIEDEIEKYPYFQTLRLLKTKASTNADEKTFQNTLNLASIYTSNRKVLFNYLNAPFKTVVLDTTIKTEEEAEEQIKDSSNQVTFDLETTKSDDLNIPEPNPEYQDKLGSDTLNKVVEDKQASTDESLDDDDKEITNLTTTYFKEAAAKKDEEETTNTNPKEEASLLSTEDLHSFNCWLKANKNHSFAHKIDSTKEELEAKYKIIDDFLEKKPKITPIKDFTPSKKKSKSKENMSHLMTETLADLYVKQNKFDKALDAYSILSLKYPEKSSYFADRIKEIKELKNK